MAQAIKRYNKTGTFLGQFKSPIDLTGLQAHTGAFT
jgi:hypothetical protein